MRICPKHWEMLREAINKRGLGHLVAESGQDAFRNIVTDLEGRADENEFEPLLACNFMIWDRALEIFGIGAMADGCPICRYVAEAEDYWISGPSEQALKLAKEKGYEIKEPESGSSPPSP